MLPPLQLTRITLTYKAQEPLTLPAFPGSKLNGLFGESLLDLEKRGRISPHGGSHLSALLKQNKLSDRHPFYPKVNNAPRPAWFSLHEPGNPELQAGDVFSFDYTLTGYYARWLPELLKVFLLMGEKGMGKPRGRLELINVQANHTTGAAETLWQQGEPEMAFPTLTIDSTDLNQAELQGRHLTVHFATFTALGQKADIHGSFPFHQLVENLLRRATLLSNLYCGSVFEDPLPQAKEAEKVRVTANDLQWSRYQRRNSETGKAAPLEGYVGAICYEQATGRGNHIIRQYLPLVLMGQYLHCGRNIVFGGGQYVVDPQCYRFA